MKKPKLPDSDVEHPVIDLIIAIKQGQRDPKLLSPSDRQTCVAHLASEGLSVAEIAQVLKCSDRTITRDRHALQAAAALNPDPALVSLLAGQLRAEAELCMTRIRRVSRDRETDPAVKVTAEKACFDIFDTMLQRLQSLGYRPTATQRVEADLIHHEAEVPTGEFLRSELERLIRVTAHSEGKAPHLLLDLKARLEMAAVAAQADEVRATVEGQA